MRNNARGLLSCGFIVAAAAIVASGHASAAGLVDDDTRFYLAPIVGASWSTLALPGNQNNIDQNLFTAGGAAGIAIPWEAGQLRVETEARYRDNYLLTAPPGAAFSGTFGVSDNWSVLTNFWRDFTITENFGIYAGAGIGGGGYSMNYNVVPGGGPGRLAGSSQTISFAWQAGGGLIYALSDRVTLDLGYRFYNVAVNDLRITAFDGGGTAVNAINLPTSFSASEMLLSLRIYEPFRGW